MKKVRFTNIYLENFGKHRNPIQAQLGQRVLISGQNMAGKSTIKRAIQWVLGSRDENGKEITGIRPHDDSGKDIDELTTVVQIGVSVDSQENFLQKTYFQKKNRQGKYTGENDTQYFIDDVRKGTKKAYEEFIRGFLPNMACISAQEFLSKDIAGRRAMLEVFSEHDTGSIIDENPDFEPIRAKLRANTVSDLKRACRDKIKTKTKERDEKIVEIRVEEQHKEENIKKLNGFTFEQIEQRKKDIKDKISENKGKQADVPKQFEEYDKQSKDILDLQFELSDLERKANTENNQKRRKIEDKISDKKFILSKVERTIRETETDILNTQEKIKEYTERLESLRKQYTAANERVFDEYSLICPYCGQEYTMDKREQMRADFEDCKQIELTGITRIGNNTRSDLETEQETIRALDIQLSEHKRSLEMLNASIADLEQQLSTLPQSIDISEREDVKAIKQQIVKKEQAMNKANSGAEIRQQLQSEWEDLQSQLNEANNELSLAQLNIEIDERVAELHKEQRELSQKIADVERELDLLKQFERKKAELIESDVNKNFELVQFRMFEKQVTSDELRDVCQILVDGESYDRNLNFSNCLLAEVDICRGFQKKYDVQSPILLDNAESIDRDRLPDVPNQLILFQRSDDKELRIEVM